METTATTGGSETAVEQSQRSDGRHHHVPEAAGMEMAASHDLRHSKRTRGGSARNMPHGPQGVGGEQARWCKEWADRRTEKAAPAAAAGVSDTGEQARLPLPSGSTSDQSGLARDAIRMDAGSSEQGKGIRPPVLF